ncbi:hypothetical protein [Halorubrum ezzemoulense]|uniref:hypothetical protein n=1 Tax=Halorubrum ezzemoulense TaxID=337243 RepID=UPI0015C64A3E|nr:hypothetical protein [Halorubrum ezzemoulense]
MVDDPTIPLGDIRQEDPDSDRQGAFKRGWTAAVKDLSDSDTTSKYTEGPPPERLTWDNLGYRLGSLFNETDDDLRQELFQWCVKSKVVNYKDANHHSNASKVEYQRRKK